MKAKAKAIARREAKQLRKFEKELALAGADMEAYYEIRRAKQAEAEKREQEAKAAWAS